MERVVNIYSYHGEREVLVAKRVRLSDAIPADTEAQAKAVAYLDTCGRYWIGGGDDRTPLYLLMKQ
jgi:hypothetical protein